MNSYFHHLSALKRCSTVQSYNFIVHFPVIVRLRHAHDRRYSFNNIDNWNAFVLSIIKTVRHRMLLSVRVDHQGYPIAARCPLVFVLIRSSFFFTLSGIQVIRPAGQE
jgi:hypothetical protein